MSYLALPRKINPECLRSLSLFLSRRRSKIVEAGNPRVVSSPGQTQVDLSTARLTFDYTPDHTERGGAGNIQALYKTRNATHGRKTESYEKARQKHDIFVHGGATSFEPASLPVAHVKWE